MENENFVQITDEEIFSKVGDIMKKLKSNRELQELAEENGLSVKNSIKLTDDTIDNVAISVIALMLAKRNNDVRYKQLTATGLQKRSLKTAIVNDYKAQANQMVAKYKNNLEKSAPPTL